MHPDLARLHRLITFLPYNLVEEAVVDGRPPRPSIRWVDGCLLSVDLSVVPPRYERRGQGGADDEASRLAGEMSVALRRILEEALFPRAGYLLKFSPTGILCMFLDRSPGTGPAPWSHSSDLPPPASRASRCGLEMLQVLRTAFPNRLTMKAGAELGRFRLAVVGNPATHLEQLVLGSLCATVASLREHAGPGELVIGPAMVAAMTGWQAHIGPQRGGGRRLMNVPPDVAGPQARLADLGMLLAMDPGRHLAVLRPLLPPAATERVDQGDTLVGGAGEARPVAIGAFPLEVDYPDDAEDSAVLLDLDAGVRAVAETVHAHGGTLLQLDLLAGGSAAVAAFGLRDTLRAASRAAVGCALQLSARLGRERTRWAVRAGIEAGRAYVGDIGSPLKREFAVVGGPAVVALELAGHAAQGQVLCGETAWRLLGDRLQGRSIGQLAVGRPARSWGVYEASTLLPEPSVLSAIPSREISVDGSTDDEDPRARLTRRLSRLLHGALGTGQGGAAVLVGGQGSGKTDAVTALAEEAARQGFRGCVVRCPGDLAQTPPSPLARLLREALRLPVDSESDRWPSAVVESLRGAVPDRASVPLLLWKLLGRTHLPEIVPPDPTLPWPSALDVLSDAIRLHAVQTPLLLVLEDVHRADALTLMAFTVLMRRATRGAVVTIATATHDPELGMAMPPHVARALQHTGARWHTLGPLSPQSALEMLLHEMGVPDPGWLDVDAAVLLGDLSSPPRQPREVRERAAFCRARMDQGRAFQAAWAETAAIADAGQLWQLRLDALHPEARDLVRVGAVLGMEFEGVLLWRTLQRARGSQGLADVMGRLGNLTGARMLTSTVVGGVVGYRFASPRLQQVAYQSIPPVPRARWHALAADALLQLPWTELTGGPGRVAHHLRHGPDPARAVERTLESARGLQSLLHLDEAAALYEAALELGGSVTANALAQAQAQLASGKPLEADRTCSALTDDLGTPTTLRAEAWFVRALSALAHDDFAGAALAARTGRKLLGKTNDNHALRTRLGAVQVEAQWRDGQPDRAVIYAEQLDGQLRTAGVMHAPVDGTPDDPVLHAALIELGVARAGALHGLGKTTDAVRALELLVRRAAACPLHPCGALARMRLGETLLASSPAAAAHALRGAVDMLDAVGQRAASTQARLSLIRAWMRAGDEDAALALLDEIVPVMHLVPQHVVGLVLALQSQLAAPRDERAARGLLEQAAGNLEATSGRTQVTLLQELARAAAACGRPGDGRLWLEEARVLAEKLSGRDLVESLDQENTLRGG